MPTGRASKVGVGGLQPLVPTPDTSSRVDDLLLAERNRGFDRRVTLPSNGRAMGTKVNGGGRIEGGAL